MLRRCCEYKCRIWRRGHNLLSVITTTTHTDLVFDLEMATAAVLTPHDVPTSLNYYKPIGAEAPFTYVYDPPEGQEKHNLGEDPHPVVVRDARDKQKEYDLSLDTSGFQFVHSPSVEKDFTDDKRIEDVYYKEVEELLKREAGAKRVFIFDHTIRYVHFTTPRLSFELTPRVGASRAPTQVQANCSAAPWCVNSHEDGKASR